MGYQLWQTGVTTHKAQLVHPKMMTSTDEINIESPQALQLLKTVRDKWGERKSNLTQLCIQYSAPKMKTVLDAARAYRF